MRRKRDLWTGSKAVIGLSAFVLMGTHGATCEQDQGPSSYGSGPTKTLRGFGNSIGAGYAGSNPFPTQRDSYFNYYGRDVASDRSWTVNYYGLFDSGEHTGPIQSGDLGIGSNDSIYAHMIRNPSFVADSDMLVLEAGGNDFLYSRGQYRSNCDLALLDARLDRWKQDWDLIIDYMATNRNNFGLTIGMNIYYPDPDNDGLDGTGPSCGGTFVYDTLLPRLLAAADYTCSTLEANGFLCADTFAVMNCDEDDNGNPDPDCPNKRVLQALADSGTCPRIAPSASDVYEWPAMDPSCIAANINRNALRDPTSLNKGGSTVNYIQSDRTHPNDAGHSALGDAHFDLGFSQYGGGSNPGPFPESNYQACIDGLDNDGDGNFDCADSGCSSYCP